MKTVEMLKDRKVSVTQRRAGDVFDTDDTTAEMLMNGKWAKAGTSKKASAQKQQVAEEPKASDGKPD